MSLTVLKTYEFITYNRQCKSSSYPYQYSQHTHYKSEIFPKCYVASIFSVSFSDIWNGKGRKNHLSGLTWFYSATDFISEWNHFRYLTQDMFLVASPKCEKALKNTNSSATHCNHVHVTQLHFTFKAPCQIQRRSNLDMSGVITLTLTHEKSQSAQTTAG